MPVTTSTRYACDLTGCSTVLENTNPDAAAAAGWTYSTSASYPVNAGPTSDGVRCPEHKGQ